jgi:hypothetical protein
VARQLTELYAPEVTILVQPSDLVIIGGLTEVAYTRAVLSEHLTFSKAHLAWSREGNVLEDRLVRLGRRLGGNELELMANDPANARQVLRGLKLPYEEWEVLFREVLVLEVALLRARLESSEPWLGVHRNSLRDRQHVAH